ncbi:MAG: hypothetical protein OCD00_17500 [Colwellia sp.]
MKNGIIFILSVTIIYLGYNYFNKETHTEHINTKEHIDVKEDTENFTLSDKTKLNMHINSTPPSLTNDSTNIEKKLSLDDGHSHIPQDIRIRICSSESKEPTCTINLNKNFEDELITSTGQLNASEIGVVLSSNNFNEVIGHLAANKTSEQAFNRESKYIDQINTIGMNIGGIDQSNIACDNSMCALSINVKNKDIFKQFKNNFFAQSDDKGNLFIQHITGGDTNIETRVLFFPDNKNGVRKRL